MFSSTSKFLHFFTAILLVGVLTLTSCGRKWKETTRATFNFKINSGTTTAGITFIKGNMFLKELDFTGDRKQGDDVSFKNTPAAQLDLSSGISVPPVNYDIPQGVYTTISLDLKMDPEGSNNSAVHLEGIYVNGADDTIPVFFDIPCSQEFHFSVQASDGSSQITLVEGTPVSADINFDPVNWFSTLTPPALEYAHLSVVDGHNVIFINDHDNPALYQTVMGRISQSNTATIH